MKTKNLYYIYGFIGIVGIIMVIQHILGFEFPYYFYEQYPNITKYYGINVVSMYADFSFFTYHTIIFFSVWCILMMVSKIFKTQKIENFLTKSVVISFIVTNYIITSLIYTIFELIFTEKITFGLYANTLSAWHNFGTNILIHYVYFILSILLPKFVNIEKTSLKIPIIAIIIYLSMYFAIVKITGMYCYVIEWYPYIIFTFKPLILVLVYLVFLVMYLVFYLYIEKIINKKPKNTLSQ
ncbi:MAG: hypothetical protein IJW82_07005 [Clostridia bacterium]|nr:hypothetical protein [Clostridia bacterium]